jgi:hypothetical protein
LSQRRVARLIPIDRMTLRYEHHRDPQDALRVRLRELAGSRVRYGYRYLSYINRNRARQTGTNRTMQVEISNLARLSFPGRVKNRETPVING